MFWRKKKQQTPPQPSCTPKPASKAPGAARPKLSLLSLESRLMFDAAATATAAEVNQEQVAQEQADAAVTGEGEAVGETQESADNQDLLQAISTFMPDESRHEVAFVDPTVPNYQELLRGMDPNIEVIMLNIGQDGIQQMASALSGRTGIDAIHLISHGNSGELQLGTGRLNQESMDGRYATELSTIQHALSEQADILVYGCDFAGGTEGIEAVNRLAELTGADVDASNDLTGHISLGGDWEFEVKTGTIETKIAVTDEAQMNWVGLLGTETVKDQFSSASYSNNNGTQSWSSSWVETDDSGGGVSGGDIDVSSNQLRIRPDTMGDSIYRQVNLSGATSSTLTFDYNNTLGGADQIEARISNNGGASYVTLTGGVFSSALKTGSGTASFDISGYMSANTRVQFLVTGCGDNNRLYVDNVQVSYETGAVNAVPTITNLSGDSLAYSEGDGAVVIDQGANALVSDSDSANFDTGTLTVSIPSGVKPTEDVLGIRNQGTGAGQIGVSGSNVTYGGVTIGTFSGGAGGNNLVITFNSNATPTAVTALVKNITYEDTNVDAPAPGALTIRFFLTDGDGGTSANYDTTVTVSGVNDAPTDLSLSGNQVAENAANGTVVGTVSGTDPDSGDTKTYSFTDSAGGRFAINSSTGQITVANGSLLNYEAATSHSVTVRVTDSGGLTYDEMFTINLTDVAEAPITNDDSASGNEDSSITGNVLANDTDGDGDSLTASLVSGPSHGSLTLNADGSFSYTPDPNWNGTDSFQYLVNDGSGLAHYWGLEGNGTDTVGGANGTLMNDPTTIAGQDGTALQFDGVNDYVALPDLTYNNEFSLAFHFKVVDNAGSGLQYFYSHGTLPTAGLPNLVQVALVEDAYAIPAQQKNIVTTVWDSNDAAGQIFVDVASLIGDGQWHQYTLTVTAGSGTQVYVDGVLRGSLATGGDAIDPTGNAYIGARSDLDSTRFLNAGSCMDSVALFNRALTSSEITNLVTNPMQATVTLTVNPVNDAPTGADATITRTEDMAHTLTSANFGFSDMDAGDSLSAVRIDTLPSAGSLTLSGVAVTAGQVVSVADLTAGNLVFTPAADANGTGYANFTFSVRDSNNAYDAAPNTLTFDVTAVNDAPTITNLAGDSLSYSEGAGAEVIEQSGNALVADVDSTDFNTGTLTVSFTAGSDSAEDVLSIRNQGTGAGQIGVNGSNVTYQGVTIGTFTGGSSGSNLVITLNASATSTAVTALVKNITYQNTDTDAPTTGARTVRYTLTDGNGGTSANSDTTVTVSGVNDAPTFSVGDGQALTSFGSGWEFGKETVIQPDGKILVGGYSDSGGTDDFSLVRYNVDGTLDTSFGGGDGFAFAGIAGRAEAMVLQTDGKVVLSGYTTTGGYQVCLVRFNSDGSLDTSFGGGDGIASSGVYGSAKDVALQTDGKFLVAADLSNSNFNLMRFNSDGSLDTSFGGGSGYVSTDLAGSNDRADSLTIQSDGKALLAGLGFNGTSFDVALVRYNTDGSLDTSFNGTGKVLTDFGANSSDLGNEVRMQADGKIVVAGWSDTGGTNDFAIARYNTNGTLDTGFGTGGKVTINLGGSDLAEGLTIQSDGKILVTGTAGINGGDVGLVRLNTDGSLDTMFGGGDGIITSNYSGASDDRGYSVAVQLDGQIVVSGTTQVGGPGGYNVALNRYSSTGSLDTTFDPVNTLNGTPTYTEGGSPVVLDADVQVFDAELSALNNYSGATLALVRNGGANAEDVFSATGTLSLSGGNAVVSGTTIGTYTNSSGTLEFTFNGNATQTLVNSAMRQIAYSNSSDAPPANVQINWTFNDGNSGSQGSGGALTATGSTTVTIAATNDAPTITNLSGDSLSYSEGDGAVVIEQGGNALVADVDSANLDTGALTVSIPTGGDSAEDVLSIRNQGTGAGQIGVSGANVTYQGVTIGTFTGGSGGSNLVITLNASATSTAVTALVKNITYQNTDTDAPTTGARTVRYTLTDGNGGTSANYNTTVTVSGVNDAPVITPIAPDVTFIEGGLPQVFDTTGTIVDVDSTNFDGGVMTVSISANGTADDRLTVGNWGTGPGQVGVSGSNVTYEGMVIGTVSGGTSGSDPLVVTFNTTATSVAVQEVYRSIQFNNVSDDPSTATRTLTIGLTDGDGGTATPQTKLVYVQGTNDAPVLIFGEGDKNFTEGALAVMIDALPNISDLDSANFDTGTLTITISANPSVDDRVELLNTGMGAGQIGVSGTNVYYGGTLIGTQGGGIGAVPFVVTFNANADTSIVGEVMANIRFWVAGDAPSTATRSVEAVLTDGDGGTSLTASKQITVTAVNDAPTDLSLSANTVAEDAANGTMVGTITGTDPDTGDTKTYSFTDSAGGRFAINSSTGQITVANGSLLDYESATSHSVTVRVTDAGGLTYDETFTINLTNVNEAPTGADATITINEDTSHTFTTVNFGFSDVDAGDSLSAVRIDTPPSAGSLTLSGVAVTAGQVISVADITAGNLVFTPAADENGTGYANFTFSVRDSNNAYDAAANMLTFNVTAVNDAPIHTAGTVSNLTVSEDAGLVSLGLGSVTYSPGGGADESGQILTYAVTALPSGTIGNVYLADGTTLVTLSAYTLAEIQGMQFQPAANASGVTAFQFNVYDSGGTANGGANTISQFILITVTAVNDAPTITNLSGDSLSYSEGDGAVVIEQSGNALVADVDSADLDTGTLTVSIPFGGDSAEDVLSIQNQGTGAGQIGVSGSNVTYQGVTIGTFTGGSGGSSLVITLNSSATPMAVTALVKNITYENTDTAAPTTGARTVRYVLTDGDGGTSANYDTTVTVTAVNDPTTITGGTSGTGNEDTTLTGTLTATDSDGLSDGTVFSVTGAATNGTASIDPATGLWSYQPTADWNGSDSFTVTITDDAGNSSTQVISVTVTPVVDLTNDSVTTTEDTAISANVLTGTNGATADSFEGTPVLTSVTQGANGSVTFLANGTVTYTPTANFNGTDSFTYTITSGGVTETATVTVTVTAVNDATVVTGGTSGTGAEDTTVTGTLTATDADGLSDGTVFSVSTVATQGTASIDPATGLWSYQSTADWNGADSFTVTITDDAGNTTTQVISVTVTPVNDAPTLTVNTGSTVAEGGTDTIDSSELAVTDVDNTAAQLTYTIGTGPAYGRLELTTTPGVSVTTFTQADIAANQLVYVHDGSETTSDSFTFTVNDGVGGLIGSTTVTLTITPVNDTPNITSNGGAATAAINVAENVSAVTIVTGADVDLPAQALTYSISGGTDQARFTINTATGALNFTAPPDFEVATDANGDNVYVVQVQVTDSQGASTTQTIQVTVTDVAESVPLPPAPIVPPVLLSPAPPSPTGPGLVPSSPSSPAEPPTDALPQSSVLPDSHSAPAESHPVAVLPSPTERLVVIRPEEPRATIDEVKDSGLFPWIDEARRLLVTGLLGEPTPTPESEPAEKSQSVSDLLFSKLDEMTASLEQAMGVSQEQHVITVRIAALTGTTLSAGFIAWALRSGTLLASFMATMPAWRHFDPLPVLGGSRSERERRRKEAEQDQHAEATEFKGLKHLLDLGLPPDRKP